MNELKDTKLRRPMDNLNLGGDVAALNGLLSLVNNPAITGAVIPPGVNTKVTEGLKDYKVPGNHPPAVDIGSPLSPAGDETQLTSNIQPAQAPSRASRLFFTGRLGVGKDYCSTAAGLQVIGFADPLYYIAQHFFGGVINSTSGKDTPGMRTFLQSVGQWGRGTVNDQYPVTPARACFVTMIRSLAASGVIYGFDVDWHSFGKDENIWLDSCLRRSVTSDSKVGITNVRFSNEFKRLQSEGWQHWHVVCSVNTWRERLVTKNLTPDSSQVRDYSEQLAAGIDADLTKKISKQPTGSKLRVIWNDSTKPPSPRLYTLSEWLTTLKTGEQ